MKQNFFLKSFAALTVIILLAAASVTMILPIIPENRTVSVFSTSQVSSYAEFSPTVIDGQTRMPVENAAIVIPETKEVFYTNSSGKTDAIRVPYEAEPSSLLEKNWREITLITYAEGYAPYALFYLQLSEKTSRQGPTIMLFPDQGKPFSIIEGPPDPWVEELIEKYQP